MSFKHKRAKLMQKLVELPEHRKHERIQGMGMTWWQLAKRMINEKKIKKVKALVRKAEEVGLIERR